MSSAMNAMISKGRSRTELTHEEKKRKGKECDF